jgi:glycosyltransferase involved in cell wall biosynthesis
MAINHFKVEKVQVAFIHGRPKGHPIHALYANQLGATFIYEDFILRWHDKPNSLKIKRYLSWIVCALFFPEKNKYRIYLTECIRIPQLVMKMLGLIGREQKLVALMADESLYFNLIGRYPPLTSLLMKLFLKKADAIICIGEFQTETAKKILNYKSSKKIYTIFNGVPTLRRAKLETLKYNSSSKNILFIGNASVPWRAWYKGIDLMIEAFFKAFEKDNELRFYIVGSVDKEIIPSLVDRYSRVIKEAVIFVGESDLIEEHINKCSLYLHCSRGDAFPTSIMEAMSGGLVPIISDSTGTVEIVKKINESLVVPLDSTAIAERIGWFFGMSNHERETLSERARTIMDDYTEEKAVVCFTNTFDEICKGFKFGNRNSDPFQPQNSLQ